ncbi:MAG TPA: sensor histidine kinase [Actinomycetota bacterium]
MSRNDRRSTVAWAVAAISIALMACSLAIKVANGTLVGADDTAFIAPGLLGGAAFAIVGALITARTGNAIGLLFLGIAASFSISMVTQNWVDVSVDRGEAQPFVQIANWLAQWPFFLSLGLLIGVFFLYPTGALPSPRWRLAWRIYVGSLAVTVVGFALLPYRWDGIPGTIVTNPVGLEPLEPVLGIMLAVAGLALVVSAFVALASLIMRARGAEPEVRQQIRWLRAVGVLGGALFAALLVVGFTIGDDDAGFAARVADVLMVLLVVTIVLGIPVATAVAILRYRLYDLDLVIRRTVIVSAMAAGITAVYVGVVVAVPLAFGDRDGGFDPVPLAAAAVVALVVDPLRRTARRLADRLVYGTRATPYEVLTAFGERVAGTYSTDDVLPRMVQVLAEAIGATSASVWLRVGEELRREAWWPAETPTTLTLPTRGDRLPPFAGEEVVEVRQQGELLGALTVTMPASEPFDVSKSALVSDLAAQAGLLLRNVRLLEDLRASRQRLVKAQDEERRRLERNIHDGVQQQLVALNVQLGLLARTAERDPAAAARSATELQAQATSTLEDLRDLARGIYPPLLADQGLAAALEAQARRAVVATTVDADGLGRYPQEVEAAVYFSVLEAMNNVAKYAGASRTRIELAQRNGALEFAVRDDGRGFDAASTARGTGLHGIADRLAAIGGEVAIESAPGNGTTIRGSIAVGGAT